MPKTSARAPQVRRPAPKKIARRAQHEEQPAQMPQPIGGLGSRAPGNLLQLQRAVGNRAVGQGLQGPQARSGSTIQRLAFDSRDWSDATTVGASSSGSSGVLFISDGTTTLVVKPDDQSKEQVLVSSLFDSVLGGKSKKGKMGESGDLSIGAPKTRTASAEEIAQLQQILPNLQVTANPQRVQDLVGKLSADSTTIYEAASGDDFSKVFRGPKPGENNVPATGKVDDLADVASPAMRIFTDKHMVTLMGRVGAVDMFTGNTDRVVGLVNFENFLYDDQQQKLSLLDNAYNASHSLNVSSPEEAKYTLSNWIQQGGVMSFIANDFGSIAENTIEALLTGEIAMSKGKDRKKAMTDLLRAHKASMMKWFITGLKEGKKQLLKSLKGVEDLTAQLPMGSQRLAQTVILARRYALEGRADDADTLWDMAAQATNLNLFLQGQQRKRTAPPRPQGPPPNQGQNQGQGNWNRVGGNRQGNGSGFALGNNRTTRTGTGSSGD